MNIIHRKPACFFSRELYRGTVCVHRGTHTSLYWLSYLHGHACMAETVTGFLSFSFPFS